MIPIGSSASEPGDWITSGDVQVRWFVPDAGANEQLFDEATEGAVALQVAAANWVTKERIRHVAAESWDVLLIGIGVCLRSIAENSVDLLFSEK
jgi:hypothetical protein